MTFLPDLQTLLTFSLACFVLFVTPGPDMSLFLSRTITGGRRAGLASMVGACTGCLVHTLMAAVGLSAVIAASPTAFLAIKIMGALYLLWLAWGAIREGSALSVKEGAGQEESWMRIFWLGFLVNLSNPKVVLFFVTFLPQFVSATDPNVVGKLAFLGIYFVAFSMPLAVLMILGAERVIASLKANPKLMRAIDYLFAGVFAAFALKIAFTERG
jgi:threonine/homoserine/homoserine lactone efflux protein